MQTKPKTMYELAREWEQYVHEHNEKKNVRYAPKPAREVTSTTY